MPTHDKTAHTDEDLSGKADHWWNVPDPEPPKPKPKAEYKREVERNRKIWEARFAPSAFESRTANAAIREVRAKDLRPKPLFLDLWHEGELAVLVGPHASGRSTLATQIAESLASGVGVSAALPTHAERGVKTPRLDRRGARKGGVVDTPEQKVVYLDLQNSDAQFARRYTAGKIKYKFSSNLLRPRIELDDIPDVYAKDLGGYLRHSLERTVEELRPDVIIIDSLEHFSAHARPDKLDRWVRYLKSLAQETNISILVTHHLDSPTRQEGWPGSAGRGGGRPFRITRADQRLIAAADTAFALCPSTYREDFRYLKSLTQTPHLDRRGAGGAGGVVDTPESHLVGANEVHVIQLQRSSSPPWLGGVPAGRGGSSGSSLTTDHRPLTTPFLGFRYVGTSPEHFHLTDYAEELRRMTSPRGRPSEKDQVVEMLLDPAYGRYLKGEK